MQGRIAVAPCGHNGETIIGTYVRCLQGCEGGVKVARRGEPGHVDNCACRPCQIRRRAVSIKLRDRSGKDYASFDWDGVADEFTFMPNKSGEVAGYKFLDKDGKIVADGVVKDAFGAPYYVMGGVPLVIKAKFMMDISSVHLKIEHAQPTPSQIQDLIDKITQCLDGVCQ